MAAISKGVTLYTAGTPNGWKVSILLAELKYPHTVKPIALMKNEQKEPWFTAINPNGRIPAIVDHDNADFPVFESGAIMMYLGEKSGNLFPQDWNKKSEVTQWLMFQMGGLGPMQGQLNHFARYAPVSIEYAQKRYHNETSRLYGVLDKRLEDREWLAADEYTIADIANFSWVISAPWAGVTLDNFPHLEAWKDRILSRPAVVEGLNVPTHFDLLDVMKDPERMAALLEESRKWILEDNTK